MTAATTVSAQDRIPAAKDYLLFVAVVLSWSGSWYAIKLQLGTVAESTSLFWRFVIAALCMWIWVRIAGERIRFPRNLHIGFAALGLFIFSLNFTLFYFGGNFLISGLLSVVFSLASIINLVMAAALSRKMPRLKVLAGALLGFCGIALMFSPQIVGQSWTGSGVVGLALCIGGTISFGIGSQVSAALQARAIPVISASAWGMTYGAGFNLLFTMLQGRSLAIEWTAAYLGSLLFLAIVSSVIAFWSYLNLLGRIGAGRAGYATVVFPVVALVISALLEDYRFSAVAFAGLALVLLGNLLVLARSRQKRTGQILS